MYEMPRYSVRVLIDELKERYKGGSMFIAHDELMVMLMAYILDQKGDEDTRYWGTIFSLLCYSRTQGLVPAGNIPGVEAGK